MGAGNSPWFRHVVVFLMVMSLAIPMLLFFSGVTSEFMSSWLNFTMSMSTPVFFYTVWKTGTLLRLVRYEEGERVQMSIAEHLNEALSSYCMEDPDGQTFEETAALNSSPYRKSGLGRSVEFGMKTAGSLLSMLPKPKPSKIAGKVSFAGHDVQPVRGNIANGGEAKDFQDEFRC